jgi:hypothetical protein
LVTGRANLLKGLSSDAVIAELKNALIEQQALYGEEVRAVLTLEALAEEDPKSTICLKAYLGSVKGLMMSKKMVVADLFLLDSIFKGLAGELLHLDVDRAQFWKLVGKSLDAMPTKLVSMMNTYYGPLGFSSTRIIEMVATIEADIVNNVMSTLKALIDGKLDDLEATQSSSK